MDSFLEAAIEEAKKGLAAGGIPIGSVLVCDGKIIGRGHNQRVQHAQRDSSRRDELPRKRRTPQSLGLPALRAVLDPSPCPMCSGAALLY